MIADGLPMLECCWTTGGISQLMPVGWLQSDKQNAGSPVVAASGPGMLILDDHCRSLCGLLVDLDSMYYIGLKISCFTTEINSSHC